MAKLPNGRYVDKYPLRGRDNSDGNYKHSNSCGEAAGQ